MDVRKLLICMSLNFCLSGATLFFGESGPGTFVPGDSVQFDWTFIGTPDGGWQLIDNSTPCLFELLGCKLGSFIFQPPRVSLPAGSTDVFGVFFGWGFSFFLPPAGFVGMGPADLFIFDIHSPAGDFSLLEPSNDGFSYSHADFPGDSASALLLSTGLVPPVVVDVMFFTLGVDPPRGPAPEGEILHYHTDLTPSNIASSFDLSFTYEAPNVPEPSTSVLFLFGAASFALARARLARRRTRHPIRRPLVLS